MLLQCFHLELIQHLCCCAFPPPLSAWNIKTQKHTSTKFCFYSFKNRSYNIYIYIYFFWHIKSSGNLMWKYVYSLLIPNSLQELGFLKPHESTPEKISRNISTMPAPRKLVQPSSNGMPSHPRSMPPPPPKFNSTPVSKAPEDNTFLNKSNSQTVPGNFTYLTSCNSGRLMQ